jgi:hypothetical protein
MSAPQLGRRSSDHRPHAGAAEELKVLGTMPTTVNIMPSRRMSRPTTVGSRSKRVATRLAQDDDIRSRRVIGGQKGPAGNRLDADRVEEPGSHPLPGDRFRRAVAAVHDHAADVRYESGDRLERAAALVPVGHVERRHAGVGRALAALPDHDQPIGGRERQRAQQRGVDQREDRAVGADAERERHGGDERERGRSPQLPE